MGDQLDIHGDKMFYRNGFTVGDLLKYIEEHKIPHNVPIVYQRIEDVYFEKHGWTPLLKEGESYQNAKQWNEDIDSGKYLDKTQYPLMSDKDLKKIPEEMMDDLKDEYIAVFTPCLYDYEYLYLNAHY